MFGGRLLLLEHRGRKSGAARYVVLETVERPDPRRIVLASGFGERSQWYRNLVADPECHVSIGFSYRRPATARTLDAAEIGPLLDRYRRDHPTAFDELSGVITEATGLAIDAIPYVELAVA